MTIRLVEPEHDRRPATARFFYKIKNVNKEYERRYEDINGVLSSLLMAIICTWQWVAFQSAFIIVYILWNSSGQLRFDSYPFPILVLLLLIELLLIAIIIGMRINAEAKRHEVGYEHSYFIANKQDYEHKQLLDLIDTAIDDIALLREQTRCDRDVRTRNTSPYSTSPLREDDQTRDS